MCYSIYKHLFVFAVWRWIFLKNLLILTADFRDGFVYVAGKRSFAGSYTVHLLNQYYKNDTAARIAVYTCDFWLVQNAFETGYVNPADFLDTGKKISYIFDALPRLKPMDTLDLKSEKERVAALFTEENYKKIYKYFHDKAKLMSIERIPNGYIDKYWHETVNQID